MDKPEALRLADALRHIQLSVSEQDAAELRRLHEVETLYRAAMRNRNAMSDEVLKLTAQRDALLEALQRLCSKAPRTSQQIYADWDYARAAIAAVEGEKT